MEGREGGGARWMEPSMKVGKVDPEESKEPPERGQLKEGQKLKARES